MQSLSIVILAAGQGKRMASDLPKVLHPLAGRPLVRHVADTALALEPAATVIVTGHGGEQVRPALEGLPVRWATQERQLGTGHAVAAALEQALGDLPDAGTVLVLYGDVPLTRADTLRRLTALAGPRSLALLTMHLDDPTGYGRILRDAGGAVQGIVEQKDADESQAAVREVNTGILAAPAGALQGWIRRLGNDNAQGEYYLTDVVAMAAAGGLAVHTAHPDEPREVMGVNDRLQLAELERAYQLRQARALLLAGVTVADPARLDVRGTLRCGRDVSLDVNVICEGEVTLGDRVRVGPGVVLRDVTVGDGTEILAHCVVEQAAIGAGARIGPFARVRPETTLAAGVHVGNFVEVKKSSIGEGSKVNHLSYVGDSEIGARVNVGAGTIIVRDAPAGELTLSRAPQTTREGWQRPVKQKP
jgi:bifunctional UDP-N-acetylglucosamine pyrophosphorylase/glucosamine-1-phosphate N-acetyltransferase